MTEADEVTLKVLACVDRTTVAEQRRRAVAAWCAAARDADPGVDEAVRAILAARRRRHGAQVTELRGARRGR